MYLHCRDRDFSKMLGATHRLYIKDRHGKRAIAHGYCGCVVKPQAKQHCVFKLNMTLKHEDSPSCKMNNMLYSLSPETSNLDHEPIRKMCIE